MKREEILNCILRPDRLKEITFDQLKKAVSDYPYSQNLHFLLAQKSRQELHPDFEQYLKTAATYMNSRSFLRKQLMGNNRPSQPALEPEPEVEPAQSNTLSGVVPENLLADLPDDELPPVAFIPDPAIDEDTPNHVADIVTDTPPADPPPPSEPPAMVESLENSEPPPSATAKITPSASSNNAPEISPSEEKIVANREPITDHPRIIRKRIVIREESKVSDLPGNTPPDASDPAIVSEEIPGTDLEREEAITKILVSTPPEEAPEIIEFPAQFEAEDEIDDLLNKTLIEVLPEKFVEEEKETEVLLEDEDNMDDLLKEDFAEEALTEELNIAPEPDETNINIQPGIGKWIKKYQAAGDEPTEKPKKKKKKEKKEKTVKSKKKSKKKNESVKAEPKGKKSKKTEKPVKEKVPENSKSGKKKKTVEDKLSKKKAIRKFANRSIVEDGETISITLADLYVKQGKTEKAIAAYERLSLIIPEKKAFFASLIKKLKKK